MPERERPFSSAVTGHGGGERGVEDKYHYRFWSQVVRWMAHGRYLAEKEGIRVIPDPERPKSGEKVFVRCRIVLDKAGFPLEDGEVEGVVSAPERPTGNLPPRTSTKKVPAYTWHPSKLEPGTLSMKVNTLPTERN